MKTSNAQPNTQATSDAALTDAQLADVVGGVTYTINLVNRTPPSYGIFQRPPTGHDQQTRDWVLRQWFSKP